MKKIILFFTVFAMSLLSCNSDDSNDNLEINQQNLLGKWYIKGGTIDNGTFENYTHDCTTNKDFQEFFSNQELIFNGYNSNCVLNDIETSNWVLNGSELTVRNQNSATITYEYNYTIENLTASELVLKESVNEPDGTFIYRNTYTRN